MSKNFYLTAYQDGVHDKKMLKTFGRLTVNIKHFIPDEKGFYQIDLKCFSNDEIEMIVSNISERTELTEAAVRERMEVEGLPIHESWGYISVENIRLWFGFVKPNEEDEPARTKQLSLFGEDT